MSEEQAKQFTEQASQSLQSGQVEQALQLIEQAIALQEKDPEAHILRGICLAQLSRPQEATEAFRKAISISPYNAKAYYNLAVHYYMLGQRHEALSMAKDAANVDPRHSGARELIARIDAELRAAGQGEGPGVNVPRVDAASPGASVQQPIHPSQPGMSAPQEPMTAPPGTGGSYGGPPGTSGPGGGPSGPPQGVSRPPHSGGYQEEPEHTMPFVANMGAGWVAIAWVLAILHLGIFVVSIFTALPTIQQAMSGAISPEEAQRQGNPVLSLLSWGVLILAWIWMIMDLSDRRGKWLWLVPQICCCPLLFITMPIYLLAGRK